MNWNRILTLVCCLLLVCCLVVNISPIRAQATGLEIALVGASAAVVVGAVLIGLGVMPAPDFSGFNTLVNDCVSALSVDDKYVTDGLVNVSSMTVGGVVKYGVQQAFVDVVRAWLFSSGTLVTATAFTGSSIAGKTLSTGNLNHTLSVLINDNPEYTLDLIKSLGVLQDVFVYSLDNDNLYGLFFDQDGILCSGVFVNPLGSANASFLGTVSLIDLSYATGYPFKQILSFSSGCPIFYDQTYLEAYPSFLTLQAQCFDWSSIPAAGTEAYFSVFNKFPNDTVIDTERSYTAFSNYYYGKYCLGTFEWDTAIYSTLTTEYDLALGEVATEDETLLDGYATWYSGAIADPGTSNSSGSETDEKHMYWPIFLPNTLEDLADVTQTDIWDGSKSDTDTDDEDDKLIVPGSDSLANTSSGTFIDNLVDAIAAPFEWLADTLLEGIKSIFVPSEDFVTTKVDTLRSEFSFADSIILTGQYIGTAFSDLETEPPVIYIDLGASEGSYNWGGKVVFVDLSWYARYKPTVDILISAFLWIVFAWRMYVKLPGIIAGLPGDIKDFSNGGK